MKGFYSVLAAGGIYQAESGRFSWCGAACAYHVKNEFSGNRYVAVQTRDYWDGECGRLEDILEQYMLRFRAPACVEHPVDIAKDPGSGRLYYLYRDAPVPGCWMPCSELLPRYWMETLPEEWGKAAEALRFLADELHGAGLALDGIRAEQILVCADDMMQLRLCPAERLLVHKERRRRPEARRELTDYTFPPLVWEEREPYTAEERDNFSVELITFWMRLGFHPFRGIEAWTYDRLEDRNDQYQQSPEFAPEEDSIFGRPGRYSFETEMLARWEEQSAEFRARAHRIFKLDDREELRKPLTAKARGAGRLDRKNTADMA